MRPSYYSQPTSIQISKPVRLYESLEETGEIRLLILRRGSGDDPIEGKLLPTKTTTSPNYEALSYVWGPEGDGKTILIDGEDRAIRENLWRALKRLRYPDSGRALWVDAICIDQTNVEERNHQVRQMKTIYQKAKLVCVWLGEGDPGCIAAFKKFKRFEKRQSIFIRAEDNYWKSFYALTKCEYWTRLWIIQELILGAEVVLHYGDSTVSWASFSKVLSLLDNLQSAFSGRSQRARENLGYIPPIKNTRAGKLYQLRLDYKTSPPEQLLKCELI